MLISTIFLSTDGRLRSGWRSLVFLILFSFASFAAQMLLLLLISFPSSSANEAGDVWASGLVSLAVSTLLAAGFAWLCGRLFEDLPFAAFGASFSKGWARHLLIGNLLGFIAIAAAILPAFVSGDLRFAVSGESASVLAGQLAASFIFFAFGAAFEEAFFRGYILQTFVRSGYGWLAIALTSVVFGIVHLTNPAADAVSTINTVLAGIAFGVAYLKTLDLWLPFGLHFMWNFAQGSIFGIEVSGLKFLSPVSLLTEIDRGPKWLTGESYGIEASIGSTFALLLVIAAIYFIPGLKRDPKLAGLAGRN